MLKILILNYNNARDTIKLCGQLLKQKNIELSILVIDNCSPDGSYKVLLTNFVNEKKIEVIKTQFNGGYAYGNNYGLHHIKEADSEYISILNNDLNIDSDLLFSGLISRYKNLNNVGFMSPTQLNSNNEVYKHSAWKQPSFVRDILMSSLICSKFLNSNLYNLSNKSKSIPVEILPGCFLFTTFKHFKKINLFDDGTFLFCEERILYEKTKQIKKQNYLINDLFYTHEGSVSINDKFSNIEKYKILNSSLLYYTRNYRNYGYLKSLILWPFLQYSLFELHLLNLIKNLNLR